MKILLSLGFHLKDFHPVITAVEFMYYNHIKTILNPPTTKLNH